jgi:nitroreductase
MEFSDVIHGRRMVRSYDPDRPVTPEMLDQLVSAALRAPSAGHTQGVSLLVLQDRAAVDAYWLATTTPGAADRWLRGMRTAPVLILVWTSQRAYLDRYAEPDKGWQRDPARWSAPFWFVDAGMASMAVLLAAVDQGLGGCFFGVPPDRAPAVRDAFAVPDDQLSVGVVSVGYAENVTDRNGSPRSRRPRKPRTDRVHLDKWHIVS